MNTLLRSSAFVLFYTISFLSPGQDANDTIKCNKHYSPVIGNDDKCYLNSCWANKAGITIYSDSLIPDSIWNKKFYKEDNPYTWYIYKVCTAKKTHELIKDLNDGTYVYKHWKTGDTFRGNKNSCKCLSSESKIKTIHGYSKVYELAVGDSIVTIDKGDTVFLPIIQTNKVAVEKEEHFICNIEFINGIKISISSEHPASDYNSDIGSLKPGDILDGLVVTSIEKTINKEKYTYDILPAGSTGTYWVNGVRLGSTLFYQLSTAKVSN